nr:hybrid sensor histidine kinase/response regulator [Massilia sp. MS-15]
MVVGDKKRLVQVFANILNNAAKYTPEGGSIELSLLPRADSVCIDVADNGIGMAPQLVNHVFELFAQAERSSDRSAGGLGLGLALVRSLVELHGGTVSCHSAGPGLGSRFTVWLPRLAQAPAGAGLDAAAPAMATGEGGLRVLVVDDNADAAETLGMVLESMGHQVAVEYGSHAALERARVAPPQVCLLDIGLPDIDGNELARRLHDRPETADAVLIAVTGYGQESDRQALHPAFAHHLVKPADIGRLVAILDEITRAARS